MANNYVLYSDSTFRFLEIPDWIAEMHLWPLTQTTEDDDGNVATEALTWNLYDAFEAHGYSAGEPFPVKELPDSRLERCSEEEATDWAVPYNSVGGDFHMWILDLAEAKPIEYEACVLSIKQIRALLVEST